MGTARGCSVHALYIRDNRARAPLNIYTITITNPKIKVEHYTLYTRHLSDGLKHTVLHSIIIIGRFTLS